MRAAAWKVRFFFRLRGLRAVGQLADQHCRYGLRPPCALPAAGSTRAYGAQWRADGGRGPDPA